MPLRFCLMLPLLLALAGCGPGTPGDDAGAPLPGTPGDEAVAPLPAAEVLPELEFDPRRDYHSYAEPDAYVARHLDLDLTVDFGARTLAGTATLDLAPGRGGPLVLDTRDLAIEAVEAAADGGTWQAARFSLGEADELLGQPLTIEMPRDAQRVRIRYRTSPEASGLQWLGPELTADGNEPFLYTQSQSIHARSWIPLQDTPAVRMTYTARVRTPASVLALMSAENDPDAAMDGDYSFEMPQPIPSYLMALAVGDLRFMPIGERTGVYAEPSVIEAAAAEFEDTQSMLETAERMFGPYRWGRYDLLILPPAFPYGGMENPRLTFATPTVIAGDKSLVSLVAHELAHSWSGNLVTNATWRDFWLNEGTTTYFTNRIMEAVFGQERAEMERALSAQEVEQAQRELPDARKPLATDPRGADPEGQPSAIAYNRGALFHWNLEQAFGRDAYDRFLSSWFDRYAFSSVTTEDFLLFLHEELIEPNPEVFSLAEAKQWIYEPELPASTIWPTTDAFTMVDRQRAAWAAGEISAEDIDAGDWTVHHWRRFLTLLPRDLTLEQMAELDARFDLTEAGNKMIARDWFIKAVEHQYTHAYPVIEEHLRSVGRMLLITPIYEALAKTPEGRALAERIYAEARSSYHPIARASVERALAETGTNDGSGQ